MKGREPPRPIALKTLTYELTYLNMANIDKNKGGYMTGDPLGINFSQWWHHFNYQEKMFLVNAINRRTKVNQVELDHLKAVNLKWVYHFLRNTELEFGKVGHMLNVCMRGKIHDIIQNKSNNDI